MAPHDSETRNPRKKKERLEFGMRFSDGAPDFRSESCVDVDQKMRPVKSDLAIAQTRSAKVRLCKAALAKHSSTFL